MKRKTLIILSILFALLFISTISFANNDIKDGVHSATDTVIDGASNLVNDARKGVGAIESTVENGAKDISNAIHHDNTNGYTTTRTATTGTTTNGMNSTLWTWVILAVASVVIIGLIWYYASQNNHVDKM
jgi:hypothetical protein